MDEATQLPHSISARDSENRYKEVAVATFDILGDISRGNEYIPYAELSAEQRRHVDSELCAYREYAAWMLWGLDVLVGDEDRRVREIVACVCFGLPTLVHDASPNVRYAVAEQGFGWDELCNDVHPDIRALVEKGLAAAGQTMEEWIATHPERCALPGNRHEEHTEGRAGDLDRLETESDLQAAKTVQKARDRAWDTDQGIRQH